MNPIPTKLLALIEAHPVLALVFGSIAALFVALLVILLLLALAILALGIDRLMGRSNGDADPESANSKDKSLTKSLRELIDTILWRRK